MFFLNKVLEPYGLKILGQLIALSGLFGLIVQPIWQLGKFFYSPGRMHKVKRQNVIGTVAVAAAVVAIVLFLPLPYSVKCTFEVQPRGAQQVFAAVPGQIQLVSFRPGEKVKPGDVILKLANPDLEYEVLELEARYQEAEQVVRNLRDQRYSDPTAIDQIVIAEEVMGSAKKQYEEKKKEFDRLAIVAETAGTIIPPPARHDKEASSQGRLPAWSGTPFDKRNVGALVTPTDLVCQLGDPSNMEAVLVVDQAYIDLVREDQPVRMLLEANTRRAFDGQIEEIAATEMKVASRGLSAAAGGRLETKTDSSGLVRPLNTSYQARVPLGEAAGELQAGMQGQARIYTGWQPLGRRLYRYCAKTFHFDL
jgi:putative peptide zinc metalloprotease protein